jgi:voltage-dependent potassium channel beta subunit
MHYRRLGKHGIRVSEVSLGGWLTQGRTIDDGMTERIVRHAFDLGINFFDSADVYNRGEAERSLGKAVAGLRRQDLVIATKCFFPMSEAPNDHGLGRKHIFESVHDSLKRLDTDYIDLMQFHRFDPETEIEESVRAMEDLVRQGKVLYWGVSEWTADQIWEAVDVAHQHGAYAPASNQPRYSMLARGIEADVVPTCEKHGLGIVVFSPLAQGVLTGKYLPGESAPQGSRGSDETSNQFMRGMLEDQALLERVQTLKAFANDQGYTLSQFALAWCLRLPAISSVITGATSPEQVEANAAASGVVLDEKVWERAESILEGAE